LAEELVPPAVRIALTHAVGGWGPYTVREIDDLFNSYGFTKTVVVPDAGGVRRTTAAEYQAAIDWVSRESARRYLDLVDEVLESYPEDVGDEVGKRLRRALQRAGIRRGSSGRLELPDAAAEASEALEIATEGIWTPDRVRIFFSHVSSQKERVHHLATELNRFAFSCFVAHDQIEPSRQWQDVIELALGSCDVLVAYVTPGFCASAWCDQEVGWALGRGLVVIPVSAGADPYGFFGTYQAVSASSAELVSAIARAIAVAVFRKQRQGATRLLDPMADAVVEAFCLSGTFDTARRRFEIIKLVPRQAWTHARVEKVKAALESNPQLRAAGLDSGRSLPEATLELMEA
jgi:hypothetical protein